MYDLRWNLRCHNYTSQSHRYNERHTIACTILGGASNGVSRLMVSIEQHTQVLAFLLLWLFSLLHQGAEQLYMDQNIWLLCSYMLLMMEPFSKSPISHTSSLMQQLVVSVLQMSHVFSMFRNSLIVCQNIVEYMCKYTHLYQVW